MFRYLLGAGELAAVSLALAYGAFRVRRTMLPAWTGAPARLAEVVLGVSALVLIPELLGTVGLFKEAPVIVALVIAGVAAGRVAPEPAADAGGSAPPSKAVHPIAFAIAAAATLLVVVHWSTFTAFSLNHGMYQSDAGWYDAPFSAVFKQTGSTAELYRTDPLTFLPWFYPQNSEVINGVSLLSLHNDFLTIFSNTAWLLVAVLAAWCIGRPWGAGPATVVGALVILDANNMLTSQPGEVKTDLIGIAFLLCAVALLVNWAASADRSKWKPALAVAGLAAGLAIGSKYTLLPPVGVVGIGIVAVAARGERLRTAAWFGLPMLASGGYWYLRNMIVTGLPLPQVQLNLGGIHLGTPQLNIEAYPQFSVAHYATDARVLNHIIRPGLQDTFGDFWWLAIGLAIAGGVLALAGGSSRAVRVAGAAVLIGGLAYLVTPATAGGTDGAPRAFVWNVRYAVPALALGIALLPVAPQLLRGERRRWALLGVLAVLLLLTDRPLNATGSHVFGEALAITVLLGAAPLALVLWGMRRGLASGVLAGAAVVAALAIGLGRTEQTNYLNDRYVGGYPVSVVNPGLSAAMQFAQGLHHQRIGIVGGPASEPRYPYFGRDLSNRVEYIGVKGKRGAFYPVRDCRTWRQRVNDGHYDYLILSQAYVPGHRFLVPTGTEARWTFGDPHAEQLQNIRHISVFRITGPLDINGCAGARD